MISISLEKIAKNSTPEKLEVKNFWIVVKLRNYIYVHFSIDNIRWKNFFQLQQTFWNPPKILSENFGTLFSNLKR
jgi:hypothetical protein